MFGLTKREQRWKAEQQAAEVLAALAGTALRAAADVRVAEAKTDAEELARLRTENGELRQPEPTQDEIDAARYRWLRDRMKVHYEAPMSGGEKRAALTMRVGHGFLDSKIHPTTGWTDQKYFDECREKLDHAIDASIQASKE